MQSPNDIGANLRSEVRRRRDAGRRMLVVLDDDPTGSQSMHGVQVVTVFEPAEYAAALNDDTSVCFVLTNTRGLAETDAVHLTARIADQLFALAHKMGRPLDIVSRGDSTLRGHVLAEVRAIDSARRRATGAGYDAILLAPAFFDAGRTTVDNVHRVRIDRVDVPAGDTEFARDATFGYRASDLRELIAEKSREASSPAVIDPGDVDSISLADIREGGATVIAERLSRLRGGRFVVVNAEHDGDYDVVALAVAIAQEKGSALLVRAAPSFVRAMAGIDPLPPLDSASIWPDGRRDGHGLIVVGSHVSGTSKQVAALRSSVPIAEFELDVARVLHGDSVYLGNLGDELAAAVRESTVLLYTSRELVPGVNAASSLVIARQVSDALTTVAGRAMTASPAWVIAKGGITSHDVAVVALGLRRARVMGQLGRGIISLMIPLAARAEAVGMPYVVFAGNVGTESSLADIVATLNAHAP